MSNLITLMAIARGEIGTKENPSGSNKVQYNTEYYGRAVSGPSYPWCCVFLWWLFKEAGLSKLFYGGKKTAYCPTLQAYHSGQAVNGGYRVGDIIFFNFSGGSKAAHVGICESWDGTYITTIDGNTGVGNEANGGAVMRRKRHKKYIVGAFRPAYDKAAPVTKEVNTVTVTLPVLRSGSKGAEVKTIQRLLNALGHDCGEVDGTFGPATLAAVKAFQKAEKLTVDGVAGQATWTAILK